VKANKIICFLVFFLVWCTLTSLFFVCSIYRKTSYIPEKNIILENTSDDAVAHLLIITKLSRNILIAKAAVKFLRLFNCRAKFGEYELPHYVSLAEALEIFASGKSVMHKITIPEGFSVIQTLRRLQKNEFLLGEINETPTEGSLLPDTYCFKYPTTKQQIIFMAQKAMREFMQQEWPRRSTICSLKTPQEALILASIIEKETYLEREMVAGVYLHRLKIGMRLQSCPTAIYAHKRGETFGRSLKYNDLKIQDPHNTYLHRGLPPTPIANPGRESILAALHPQETENLFFVCDGLGGHLFSRTFDEHKRNIRAKSKISAKPTAITGNHRSSEKQRD
jgi:UPF0755 protein